MFDGLAELARWRGRLEEAAAAVIEGLAQVANTGDDEMVARLCLTGIRVEADRRARSGPGRGDVDQSMTHAEELLDTVRSSPGGSERPGRPGGEIQAAAATAQAEMERVHGRASAEAWQLAVRAWQRLSTPYQEAVARWRLAEALLSEGRKTEAEGELVTAHEMAVPPGCSTAPGRHRGGCPQGAGRWARNETGRA